MPLGSLWSGYHVVVIRELLVADRALLVLLDNLAIQQLSHLGWGPQFPVSSRMMRIFNPLNTRPQRSCTSHVFATTAEQRAMNRTAFVRTESHGVPQNRVIRLIWQKRQGLGSCRCNFGELRWFRSIAIQVILVARINQGQVLQRFGKK